MISNGQRNAKGQVFFWGFLGARIDDGMDLGERAKGAMGRAMLVSVRGVWMLRQLVSCEGLPSWERKGGVAAVGVFA